jgi:hypothetical protein
MSVGAWVGHTAVWRARADGTGAEPDEVGGTGLSSWRELVAALVALRGEVAAVRRVPGMTSDPAAPAGQLLDGQPSHGTSGRSDRGNVVEMLRRIDTVTAAAVEATSSAARRRSSPTDAERSGQS